MIFAPDRSWQLYTYFWFSPLYLQFLKEIIFSPLSGFKPHWQAVILVGTFNPCIIYLILPVMILNYFRRGSDGGLLWPGFGDNIRVLEWALNRSAGKCLQIKIVLHVLYILISVVIRRGSWPWTVNYIGPQSFVDMFSHLLA